jgi:hypothetical protein
MLRIVDRPGLLSSAPCKPKFSVQNSVTGTTPSFLNSLKPCAPRGSVHSNRQHRRPSSCSIPKTLRTLTPSRTVNQLRSTLHCTAGKHSSRSILSAGLQTPIPAGIRCRGYKCFGIEGEDWAHRKTSSSVYTVQE